MTDAPPPYPGIDPNLPPYTPPQGYGAPPQQPYPPQANAPPYPPQTNGAPPPQPYPPQGNAPPYPPQANGYGAPPATGFGAEGLFNNKNAFKVYAVDWQSLRRILIGVTTP